MANTIHPAAKVVQEAMSLWDDDSPEMLSRRAMMVVSHLIEFGYIDGTHCGIFPHKSAKAD